MPSTLPTTALDHILAVQIAVAWAGEARCEPTRLGWWQTDLVDEAGGGDLLRRLLPRTHRWAALAAVREAARRVDAAARAAAAEPDRLASLFHLGAELDEDLEDRLAALRRAGADPAAALPGLTALDTFDRDAFADRLRHGVEVDVVKEAAGRRVRNPPPPGEALVDKLAAALVPFAPTWPFPHARVER